MPKVIETTVYQLEVLSECEKETARHWYRTGAYDQDWYRFVFEDFERICKILVFISELTPCA